MCPLLLAGATVQPRSLRRLGEQPPSARGRVLPLLRRRVKALQPPRRGGPRRAAPEQGSKCAAPEQGTSDRPVKKARVHSKM
jgi:hypothetical protein